MDSPYDSGLFQHSSDARYSHLLREILLTHRQLMRRLSAESGLSGAQFEVMRELALADGRSSVSALARSLDVDPAAISRLVAGLSGSGFVTRESDETDKRRQPVVLTEMGRGFMLAFHQRVHDSEAVLAGSVDAEAMETATKVLSTLREALESASRRR
jgi:DNA-binding MarR family transcriptional regulator